MSRHPKSHQRGPKASDTKDEKEITSNPGGAKSYKKIHLPELPTIDLNSGPNISHIREAITQYCQRELGPISNIFLEGKYRPPATAEFDPAEVEADRPGVKKEVASARLKRAEIENEKYEVSKGNLHGILSGMTSRELDERIATHRDSLKLRSANVPTKASETQAQASAAQLAKAEEVHNAELQRPLA